MLDQLTRAEATAQYPVRRMGPRDTDGIAAFVAGLDEPALHARFHRHMTAGLVHAHYRDLEWANAVLLTWMACTGIRGLAEALLYDGPFGREAETVVCVGRPWRGRGIGPLLLARVTAVASARGAVRSIVVLPDGPSAEARLALDLGGTIGRERGVAVLPATQLSA